VTVGLIFTEPRHYDCGAQCVIAVETPEGHRHAAMVEVDPPYRPPTAQEVNGMKEVLTLWAAQQRGYV
jgi:hypothetical protein